MTKRWWFLIAALLIISSFLYRDSAQAINTNACATSGSCYVTGQFTTNNTLTTPHVCGSFAYVHTTSNTDTQIINSSGSKTIYICSYIITTGTLADTVYLEKSSTGTCGSPTQIGIQWPLPANGQGGYVLPYYEGLNTGASQQLCVNTSSDGPADIGIYYDQY